MRRILLLPISLLLNLNMQGLFTCVLIILCFVSPCLCRVRWNNDLGSKNNSYDVTEYGALGDGKSDDSQAFLSAWKKACRAEEEVTLVIPPSKSFMVTNIMLNGPCKATSIHIQLLGEIVAPSMDEWGSDTSNWMMIQKVNDLTIDGGGLIHGNGSTWWTQCNKKSCERPTALRFHSCNDLTVRTLSMIDSPGAHISINGCDGVRFSNMSIQAPGDSPNTDGFDISDSKSIFIENSTIATGDDCIAINGGTSYINITGITCGPGHGISIGSLGKNEDHEIVEEVYVRNCSLIGTQNGARIKTFQGGSGYARKITFEKIELIRTHRPIIIDQYYDTAGVFENSSAVQVSEVTYRGFKGTSADDKAIILDCSSSGCLDLVFDQIEIVSSLPGKIAHASCRNAHGTVVSSAAPNVTCLLS